MNVRPDIDLMSAHADKWKQNHTYWPMAFHQHHIKLSPVCLSQSCIAKELFVGPWQGLGVGYAGRGGGGLKLSMGQITFGEVRKSHRSMNLRIVSSFVYLSVLLKWML